MNFLNNKDSEDKRKSSLPLTKCDAQAPIFGKNGGNCSANENVSHIIAQEFSISTIWAHAVFFARCGFKVFPLLKRSKRPLIKEWPEKATNDEAIIVQWAETYPENNYALLTGNGWFVLDFDPRGATGGGQDGAADEAGYVPLDIDEELQRVQTKLGSFEPGTLVKTGRGFQLYCSADGFDIRNDHEKRLTDRVDIKGSGGYVVGPGSIHPNGQRYEFVDPCTLEDGIKLTKLSPAALQYIVSLQGGGRTIGADDESCARDVNSADKKTCVSALNYGKPIPEGARNDTLFRIACHYREVNGLEANEIFQILRGINKADCEAPLGDSELMTIAVSSCSYSTGMPRNAVKQLSTTEPCSDDVLALFEGNKFITLYRRNVQKFHVGDEPVAELLAVSVASMSVKNTKGTQPKLSGESGMGKTHISQTALHVMPPEIYRIASFSSKALFYDKTLRPKMVILSDDRNLAPDVEETVRAGMTNWDSPTVHITLDGKRNPVTLSLPPRVVFWLTSVSSKSTMQLQNRQVEMNVDESPGQDKRVEQHQRRLAESGLSDFYVDDEVELLRGAFLHLNGLDFVVKVPFIDHIRFTDVRNRRNLPIFLDVIKAYCIMNYRARETDEEGALIATKEDYVNALELFKTVAVQQVTKLNEREREIAGVIKANRPCDVETIMDETRLSRSRVSELLHGQKDSGNQGMLEKIPQLKYHSRYGPPPSGGVWGRRYYELPEDWSIVDSCEAIVYWDDTLNGASQLRAVSGCFGDDSRNSGNGMGGLDSSLRGGNGHIIHNTNTTFGTLEEYKAPLSGASIPALDRSSETEPSDTRNRPKTSPNPGTDTQTAIRSISETRSEVELNSSEIDNTGGASDAADEPQDLSEIRQLIHDYLTVVKQQEQGKKLSQSFLRPKVAYKVKDLSNDLCDLETIFGYYDRLITEDKQIGALISSICGGEPLRGAR
jgi:hypothetical protein